MNKTVLCFVLILFSLALCSCSLFTADSEPMATPEPSFEPTPAKSDTGITVDGKALPETYCVGDEIYIKLSDWEQLFGADETDELSNAAIFDGKDSYIPITKLIDGKGYTELRDEEYSHIYYTPIPDVNSIPEGIDVPILMYHAVSDDCWGIEELFVSPSEMDKQLAYLKDNGYTTITFEDFPRIDEIEKPVMLTFDDGYLDNYTELFPLLKKYESKATIFIITDAIYSEKYLNEAQIKEMSDSGLVSIQSHTVTHAELGTLNEEQLISEIELSRLAACRLTGKEPFVLCYPFGSNSELSREVTERYYSFGLIMNGGKYTSGNDRYSVPRIYISRSTDINSFAGMIG